MFGSKPPHKIFIDDTHDPLPVKIERCAQFFKNKTGARPNFCSLPYAAVKGTDVPEVEGIKIFLTDTLTDHSIWLGIAHPGES